MHHIEDVYVDEYEVRISTGMNMGMTAEVITGMTLTTIGMKMGTTLVFTTAMTMG